jgi:gamma-glutamylcyclotransferase (GGCT)/AIG2-like uncharacterized protein YtfP
MSEELVFVYGTLRRGASNHFRMQSAQLLGEGHVFGKLYLVTWYPALCCGGVDTVVGELYRVSTALLAALDAFEGVSGECCEYRRVKAEVSLKSGGKQQAWVWEWQGEFRQLQHLKDGDWLQYEPSAF